MTIKLPLILSTMLATFAISGTVAGDTPTTPAPNAAAPATEATPAAATSTDAATPAAKKGKKARPAEAMDGQPKKKHYRKHRHHHGGGSHTGSKWDAPWDYIQQGTSETYGCSGDTSAESSPKMPIPEVPGQKTP